MNEEDSSSVAKDKDSTLLLTKDGQRYYVNKSGVVDSRNVVTPHEAENNISHSMDDADEESDVLDPSDPRDSAASPEELNDEETSEGDNAPKQCTYEGCTETTTQVAKQRKPWMCKKHRNKMYKDKYKRKKSDQAMSSGKLDVRQNCFKLFSPKFILINITLTTMHELYMNKILIFLYNLATSLLALVLAVTIFTKSFDWATYTMVYNPYIMVTC
uniref:Regulatory factor X-associated protein n=1 Tax=Iconisemion striatum TaxID=60296 RepID=A0A1A7XMG3_9TELE